MNRNSILIILVLVSLAVWRLWPANPAHAPSQRVAVVSEKDELAERKSLAGLPHARPSSVAPAKEDAGASVIDPADSAVQSSDRSGSSPEIPEPLYKSLGRLATQAWNHISNMSTEEVRKNSSVFTFGEKTRTGGYAPARTSGSLSAANEAKSDPEGESQQTAPARFIHWGDKENCRKTEVNQIKTVPTSSNTPPRCVGFFIRSYDEFHKLLKQTFLPAELNDPLCCGYYEILIQEILPPELSREQFGGYVALTSAMGEKRAESEEIWLNLAKPKGLGTN